MSNKGKLLPYTLLVIISIVSVAVAAAVIASWSIKFSWTVIEPQSSNLTCYTLDGSILRVIDWGTLEQGKTYTYSFIVKNTGDVGLSLHLNKPNNIWVSGNYGELSWDRENYVLNPRENVTATLSWYISSTAPTGTYTEELTIGIDGYPP